MPCQKSKELSTNVVFCTFGGPHTMESVRDLIYTAGKKWKYKHNEKEAIMNIINSHKHK